ncbi:MAG: hypothetical protein NZ949_08100, partial [Candidatus Kapabacteria bacterium]|nr:hypothetical protein [Candidatus Kapabacteria bacterium]MDW7997706.1 hypothetical protein [Bacteroidota bacterium]
YPVLLLQAFKALPETRTERFPVALYVGCMGVKLARKTSLTERANTSSNVRGERHAYPDRGNAYHA